ncbi:Protein get1 [Schizosaccharomyces pombe]
MDLIISTILLSLFIHFFDKFAKKRTIDGAYRIYVSVSNNKDLKKNKEILEQLLTVKKELNATSSQDQFAKWARLNRKYEQLSQEWEKQSANVKIFQDTFKRVLSLFLWILTRGFRFYIQFKESKTPVFFLPAFLLPSWALWVLSLPRSIYGSVSLTVWNFAVQKTISGIF